MSEFEKKLQQFFPDLFAMHELSKTQPHVIDVLQAIAQLQKSGVNGSIMISLVKGEISGQSIKVDQNFKKIDKEQLSKLK